MQTQATRPFHSDTTADRTMRRILRIEGPPQPGAIFGATQAMGRSLAISGIRCIITYLLIPIVTPIIGISEVFGAPLSITLCLIAAVLNVRSVRRFWIADHKRRWAYTAFGAVVMCFLAFGIGTDIVRLAT